MGAGATSSTTGTTSTKTPAAPAEGAGKAAAVAEGGSAGTAGGALTGGEGANSDESLLGGGEKAAGKAEGEGSQTTAPADIELKLPDGYQPDEAFLGKFKGAAKELGLDSAKAQKMFDLYAEAQTAEQEAVFAGIEATQQEWVKEIRSDKDFGGEHFDASVRSARKAIERFGPELRPWLNESGLTNHPGLFRVFARIGAALDEDSSAGAQGGKESAQPADPYAALAKKLYRNTGKQG